MQNAIVIISLLLLLLLLLRKDMRRCTSHTTIHTKHATQGTYGVRETAKA